jgi:hypothetical protein
LDKVGEAAGSYGTQAEVTRGTGEFLGTQLETGSDREQRDDARRVYQEAIATAAHAEELRGRDIQTAWSDLQHHWFAFSGQALRAKHKAIDPTGKTVQVSPLANPEYMMKLKDAIYNHASTAGFTRDQIKFLPTPPPKDDAIPLEDANFNTVTAMTRTDLGIIEFYEDSMQKATIWCESPEEAYKQMLGVAAHECEHLKFFNVQKGLHEEHELMEAMGVEWNETDRDGRFPLDFLMKPYQTNTAFEKLARLDGCSDYSAAYWKQLVEHTKKNGQVDVQDYLAAVHETLAEIARLKQIGAGDPPAYYKPWDDFFKTVDKAYLLVSSRKQR